MKPEIKKKLKNAPFVVDWDAGERYYQIHIFEDADGLNWIQISSKINKDGKIEMFSRGSKESLPFTAEVTKPATKEKFKEAIDLMEKMLEGGGFIHRFIDLSNCNGMEEVALLLTKSDKRFKVEIKHKSELG